MGKELFASLKFFFNFTIENNLINKNGKTKFVKDFQYLYKLRKVEKPLCQVYI